MQESAKSPGGEFLIHALNMATENEKLRAHIHPNQYV